MTDLERKKSINAVRRFKQLMRQQNIPLRQTIMFGSRARGDADPDSDLDVLVIVDELSLETRKMISHCAWEAGFEIGVIIQPVALTQNQVENGPERASLLMLAVAEEGVPV